MNILVLNTGSSSLKFQIIDTDMGKIEAAEDKQLAKGIIERIGQINGIVLKNSTCLITGIGCKFKTITAPYS